MHLLGPDDLVQGSRERSLPRKTLLGVAIAAVTLQPTGGSEEEPEIGVPRPRIGRDPGQHAGHDSIFSS